MKDKDFKQIKHSLSGFLMFKNGGDLEEGYRPDYVLSNSKGMYIIMESEKATSRKHIIGGLLKAAHFLRNDKSGILIIVLEEKGNTKKEQIHRQVNRYFNWLKKLTNLKSVYIITDLDYCFDNKNPIKIFSRAFNKKAICCD